MPYDFSAIKTSLEATASQLIKEMQLPTYALPELLPLVGKLLAAEAYCSSGTSALSFVLHCARVRLRCNDAGEIVAVANIHVPSPRQMLCYYPPAGEPLEVEHDDKGNTYYIIQNLNIYLTADVVQQLNVNPKEVINNIHEQIKEEIDKITKEEIDNGTHAIVVNK